MARLVTAALTCSEAATIRAGLPETWAICWDVYPGANAFLTYGKQKQFASLSSKGVSASKKKEAKKVFLEKLTEKEYDQLIAIAAKLGLSQGKSYEESTKRASLNVETRK